MNIEAVLHELDPRHDLDRYNNRGYPSSFSDLFNSTRALLICSGKSIVRGLSAGAIIGGSAGAVYGMLSGQPVMKYTLTGSILGANTGMTADYLQFLVRYSLRPIHQLSVRSPDASPHP